MSHCHQSTLLSIERLRPRPSYKLTPPLPLSLATLTKHIFGVTLPPPKSNPGLGCIHSIDQ